GRDVGLERAHRSDQEQASHPPGPEIRRQLSEAAAADAPGSAVYRLGRKTRWDPYDNQRRRCRRKSMPKTISASFIFTSATRISGLAITRGPTFRFAKR